MELRALQETLGRNVRHARLAAGWTQEELMSRVGVEQDYVSKLERGLKNPQLSTLLKFADALGVGADELLRPVDCTTTR
jgi:transcriptional regulator with XRE-family HTH domain